MNFEELRVVWDSETKESHFTLNEAAMHAAVRRRNEEIHRRSACCQKGDILGGFGSGLALFAFAAVLAVGDPAWLSSWKWIRVPVSGWHAAALFLSGFLLCGFAVRLYGARQRQLRHEEDFADSLRGDLDRAIAHMEFQIKIARSSVWWGLIPQWVATCLFGLVVFNLKGFPVSYFSVAMVTMGVLLAVVAACQLRAIDKRYVPRIRQLSALRAKLADAQR